MRLKKALFTVLALIISFTIILSGLEIGLRVLGLQDSFAVTVNTWDREVGTKQVPGANGFLIVPQYRTDLIINSKGLRDREFPYVKPSGAHRILCLGDSFTCGYGVQAEETFAKILEGLVNDAPAGGSVWEVLNAGVGSTGTAHQLAWFDVEGHKYSPDLVVLTFYPYNDLWDSLVSGLYSVENGRLVKHDAPETGARRIQSFTRWIPGYDTFFARSHLFNYIKYQFAAYHFGRLGAMAKKRVGSPELDPKEDDLTRHLLVGLQDACSTRGARLVMMVIPEREAPRQSDRILSLIEFARGQGIPCLDLAPLFAPSAGETTYRGEGHWNQRGHALAARCLHEFLEREGLLASGQVSGKGGNESASLTPGSVTVSPSRDGLSVRASGASSFRRPQRPRPGRSSRSLATPSPSAVAGPGARRQPAP